MFVNVWNIDRNDILYDYFVICMCWDLCWFAISSQVIKLLITYKWNYFSDKLDYVNYNYTSYVQQFLLCN